MLALTSGSSPNVSAMRPQRGSLQQHTGVVRQRWGSGERLEARLTAVWAGQEARLVWAKQRASDIHRAGQATQADQQAALRCACGTGSAPDDVHVRACITSRMNDRQLALAGLRRPACLRVHHGSRPLRQAGTGSAQSPSQPHACDQSSCCRPVRASPQSPSQPHACAPKQLL